MDDKLVPIRFNVPEQFRNEFKAACAKAGKSQAEVARELMSRFIKGEIKL